MSQIKKLLSVIIVCAMITAIFPFSVFADTDGVVYLTIENTTYPDGAWVGVTNYEIELTSSEMTIADVLSAASEQKGIVFVGIEENYISVIDGLAAFDGGVESGWMVTLNDWFISAGVDCFYVSDGDCISFMYTTQGYGEDIGSSWNNNYKSVNDINFSCGELNTEFSPEIYEYTLTVPAGTESVKITPTATNKNFQTRIYLNTEFSENEKGYYIEGEEEYESILCGLSEWSDIPENIGYFKRTQTIPIKEGDVIAVGCGLPYWSSMNSGDYGSGAENEVGTVYFFTVEIQKEEITASLGVYDYTAVTYKENHNESGATASENGIVFEVQDFLAEEGITVLDAIKTVFDNRQIEYAVDERGTYIQSIGELSEMDCSAQSGWMISVNDRFLEVSASELLLEDGDVIKLHYSVNGWGADVGSYFSGGPVIYSVTIGTQKVTISSNTVYADENDYTGTTTYYLGEYVEGGENTMLEGNGSIESPFIIPISVSADTNVTALSATLVTSLHEKYLKIGQGEGLQNILEETNYESDVTFAIETLGGFKKNYYTVRLKKDVEGESGNTDTGSDDSTSDDSYSSPSLSGGSASAKKETTEETEKEEIKEETLSTVTFSDTQGHWAESYIQRLAQEKIITGKTEKSFAPDDKVTRAELVTLLYRLSKDTQKAITNDFSDVGENEWYAAAISWAKEKGIASGMTISHFMPDEFVDREQIAVFIIRYCEIMGYKLAQESESSFKDESELSDWSYEYVLKAQKYGIINGYEDGTFKGKNSTTRAQTAKLLCAVIDKGMVE